MDIKLLGSSDDFKTTIGDECGVIIDPITYRTAELFFLGSDDAALHSGIDDKPALIDTIKNNKEGLFTFIDSLILRKKLPMIAYSLTIHGPEDDPGGTPELLKRCNDEEENVLLDVRLTDNAYGPIKKDAIDVLNKECPKITNALRKQLLPGLKAFKYRWKPDLRQVKGFKKLSADDKLLMTFLFGRVVFSRYAQAAQADEVLPPELGRFHVLASLRNDEQRKQMQNHVFSGLREIAKGKNDCVATVDEVPWAPTFLPHLLSKDPKTPHELLRAAINLRKESLVSDYREWFEEMERDFDAGREPTPVRLKQLETIRENLEKKVGMKRDEPIKVKWHIAVAQKGLEPPKVEAGVQGEAEIRTGRLWGWISSKLKGDQYRKVLMELICDERRYRLNSVGDQLERIWSGRGQ